MLAHTGIAEGTWDILRALQLEEGQSSAWMVQLVAPACACGDNMQPSNQGEGRLYHLLFHRQ